MRGKLKVFYVATEVSPFARTSDLGEVAGAYPKYLKNLGHDIRVMMPNYKSINERKFILRDVIRLQGLEIKLGDEVYVANAKSSFIPNSKVQIYFLDNKFFFDKEGLYFDSNTGLEFQDNAQRFLFFSIGCLETLKLLHWQPDIIHCNDWQTALIPLLLKSVYRDDPFFKNSKTLLSIHDLNLHGIFDSSVIKEIALLPDDYLAHSSAVKKGKFSFLRAGLEHADLLNTVSETYAQEIQVDSEIGFGFESIFKKRKDELFGILNGVDYEVWNPEVDRLIPQTYDRTDLSGKQQNKRELLERFNLDFDDTTPVIGFISCSVDHQGLDLLTESLERLMQMDLQLIVLGEGARKYHRILRDFQKKIPHKLAVELKLDYKLTHLMMAGCDMYLMPSRFEPCGLHQMYSLKYGTVPIVRETGGLSDSIKDFNSECTSGTGFVFRKYEPSALFQAIDKAVKIFRDRDTWLKLIQKGMKQDFSWKTPVQKYVRLYQRLISARNSKS
ncbi:MAG: glycogen synthase [bacterium]